MSDEEIELLLLNLCLDEKQFLEQDEMEFAKRLLELYEKREI